MPKLWYCHPENFLFGRSLLPLPKLPEMIYLREIDLRETTLHKYFPFNLPVFSEWEPIIFSNPVTFLVGENGSGKSTLLEAIACASQSIAIGSESVNTDPTLKEVRKLSDEMKLIWNKPNHQGFFLRAEDFYNYVKKISSIRVELESEISRTEREYQNHSTYAKGLAKMPFIRELQDIKQRYGDGLDVYSHGESFLEFFQERFIPGGMYLLDEPEAALSPLSQLGFLSLLKEMVLKDAQFIISTHSPILMAYPGALLLNLDQIPISAVLWDELEHVTLTRDFLNSPNDFLRHL